MQRRRSAPHSPAPSVSARHAALRLLNRRDYSVEEITARLLDRGYEETDVQEAVAALRGEGLLDDERVAKAHVRTSGAVKGRGRRRIRRELEARGLDRAVVETAIADLSPESERATLERLIARNLPRGPLDETAERRLFQRLLRRGFDLDTIRAALKTCKSGGDR